MKLLKRKLTPAIRAANRANGAHSTGPRTKRGRSIVRCNALKHWGRAEAMRDLMPALGEDPAEFQALLDGLCRSLGPKDAFEILLVTGMADIQWRLRRSIRAETATQAKRRRKEMQRLDELNAKRENGGSLIGTERALAPMVGLANLPDSSAKFYRVIEILKTFSVLVRHDEMGGEGVVYLRALYGPAPSAAGQGLMSSYESYLAALESKDEASEAAEARKAASRQAFLETLEAETAWFEKRAAAESRARAELAGPSVESEMLYAKPDPDRVMLYQERQERRFEKKWELLIRYRRWRQRQKECEVGERSELPPGAAGIIAAGDETADGTSRTVIPAPEGIHATPGSNTGCENPKMNEQSRQAIENTGSAFSENQESRQDTENTPVAETFRQPVENKRHKVSGLPPRPRRRR